MSSEQFLIVLVEDNPADVYLWREALKSAKLDVEILLIEDGADAITYVAQEGKYFGSSMPDLVILDMSLPRLDGPVVLEALRKSQRFAKVPVVVATSTATPNDRAKAEQLGVQGFLTKQIDLDAFLEMGMELRDLLMQTSGSGRAARV